MMKSLTVGLGVIALSLGNAFAQRKPTPKPAPPPPAPAPAPAPAAAPAPPPDAPPAPASQPAAPQEKASNEMAPSSTGTERPWAAGVSQEQQDKALQLFRDANQYHNDGLFAKAVDIYREALKSWDHPAINYNMALSLMQLDKPTEVEIALQKAIKFGVAPLAKDKFDHAKEYLVLIQQQLATIDVLCTKPGAKVSVDGKEVYTVNAAGQGGQYKSRVKIGKHTFVAEKPGYNAEIDAPFIGPGETFRIELKLYTAEELTRHKRLWKSTWVPWLVVGAGVAIAGGGALLEMSANSSYKDFDDAVAKCTAASGTGCANDSSIKSKRDSGDTKKTMGYIAYGVGAATVVTGAILVWVNRSTAYQITADEYRKELREKEKAATPTAKIEPMIGPGVAGAMVRGAF
jgi:hypothetical protein